MFFVLDENHNLVEAYDKEGVLAVLEQAIADGSLSGITENSAFVSQLKCCVSGQANKIAFVTQAKYNEMKESNMLLSNCLYFVIDDTTADDIDNKFTEIVNGTIMVENARTVNSLPIVRDSNGVLKIDDVIIPQRKLLWSGEVVGSKENPVEINLGVNLRHGDRLLLKVRRHQDSATNTTRPLWFEAQMVECDDMHMLVQPTPISGVYNNSGYDTSSGYLLEVPLFERVTTKSMESFYFKESVGTPYVRFAGYRTYERDGDIVKTDHEATLLEIYKIIE